MQTDVKDHSATQKHGSRLEFLMFEWRVLSTPESVLALETEWRRLHSRAVGSTVFQSFEWTRACLGEMRTGTELRFLALWEHGELILVWPMSIRRVARLRIATWFGEALTHYGDVLLAGENRPEALRAAWDLINRWEDVDLFHFRTVREDGDLLSSGLFDSGVSKARTSAPFMQLSKIGTQTASRSTRTLSTLRRKRRRLGRLGTVSTDRVDSQPRQVDVINEAFRLKREWLSSRGLYSQMVSDLSRKRLLSLTGTDILSLFTLSVDGQTAAIVIALECRRRLYSFLETYSEKFAEYSPGKVLLLDVIDDCSRRNIDILDFMTPSNSSKEEWATGSFGHRDIFVAKSAAGCILAMVLKSVKPTLKSFTEDLPLPWRQKGLVLFGLWRGET